MTHFEHLRTAPWEPRFEWVATVEAAAMYINSPHEDFPLRCTDTELLCRRFTEFVSENMAIGNPYLWAIHRVMFFDESFRGRYRDLNVTVGPHRPPDHEQVPSLMDNLHDLYIDQIESIEDLMAWYTDFETIHPFQDGNGRVGGVIVAALSHQMEPEKGYLAPLQ